MSTFRMVPGRSGEGDGGTVREFWLLDSDTPVGYLKLEDFGDYAEMREVEIRPTHRGHGLGARSILCVEKGIGKQIRTSGVFSPEGLRSLAPMFANKESAAVGRPVPTESLVKGSCGKVKFVKSWDARTTHAAL